MAPHLHTLALAAVALASVVAATPISAQGQCDQNHLVNSFCELPLQDGEIPGWIEVQGEGWTACNAVPPRSGQFYFCHTGPDSIVELAQDLDLGPIAGIVFEGNGLLLWAYIRTGPEPSGHPSDTGEVILEFWGDTGSTPISSHTSGPVSSVGAWRWTPNYVFPPNGATRLRVRMRGVRHSGSTLDAWFDSITLTPVCPDPVVPTTWSRVKRGGAD